MTLDYKLYNPFNKKSYFKDIQIINYNSEINKEIIIKKVNIYKLIKTNILFYFS
jgi:hypothetical protein